MSEGPRDPSRVRQPAGGLVSDRSLLGPKLGLNGPEFLGLLLASCVETVHVKNAMVFTLFIAFNNDLTSSPLD